MCVHISNMYINICILYTLLYVWNDRAWYFYMHIKCLKKLCENWTWSDCGKMFWCLCSFFAIVAAAFLLLLLRLLLTIVAPRGLESYNHLSHTYIHTHTHFVLHRLNSIYMTQHWCWCKLEFEYYAHEEVRSTNKIKKNNISNMKMNKRNDDKTNENCEEKTRKIHRKEVPNNNNNNKQ